MIVRTIAQLPEVNAKELQSSSESVMEVSYKDSNEKFQSRKVKVSELQNAISEKLSSDIVNDYGLKKSGANVSLSALYNYSHNIVDLSGYFKGPKEFRGGFPWCSAVIDENAVSQYGDNIENVIPNVKYVKKLVNDDQKIYVSTDDSKLAGGNPFVDMQPGYEKHEQDQDHFYYWKIDHDKKDSSESTYDEYSKTKDPYEEMGETGNLVMWGWLADQGQVDAEFAWVGLFANMSYDTTGDETGTTPDAAQTQKPWIPLQIKPWIRGENASIMQYISFNVPVKKGLRLKVMTGFPVNGQTGGAKNTKGSLTFYDTWSPNSFFGYIIK